MSRFLEAIGNKLQVDQNESIGSKDSGPVPPPEKCTWGVLDYFAVFPWPAFCISSWTGGSMLLALGLTVPQAIGAATVALSLQTAACVAVGHSGSVWRLSNPLGSRLSWGVRGYAFTIVCGIVVTTCLTGVQMVFGYLASPASLQGAHKISPKADNAMQQCIKVVICAMIPSFATMNNSFSNTLPTNDFICMIIFLAFSFTFYYLPLNTWRIIGPYAAMLTFTAFVTIVAVCCSKANGVGPLFEEPFTYFGLERKPTNSHVIWAFFLAVSSILGGHTILNEANFTRFSKSIVAPIPAQIAGRGFLKLLITLFGIIATSAAVKAFPEEKKLLWAPYEVLLAFQQLENAGPGTRAVTFFGGLVMVIPQLEINVVWNAYGNGLRFALLFPRWFTVKRGGFLTLALAVAVNPWLFATEPVGFNLFLNGTAILWGCLTGIFLSDYFIVRKALVKVSDLLLRDERSVYWYTKGINWRAASAAIASIWLVLPGWIMVMRKNGGVLDNSWEKMYGLSWMLTFVVSGLAYYIFSKIWLIEGLGETDPVQEDVGVAPKEKPLVGESQSDEENAAPSPISPAVPV